MGPGLPRKLAWVLTTACLAAAAAGCGAGQEDERAAAVAERFYAAVSAKDGSRACAQLSESTVSELEKEEMAPCHEAVTDLQLVGASAQSSTVYVSSARVSLRGGDDVFLDRTPEGWKVSAAGCKPEPGEEQPEDCELES
jgi:hypothetical protein